MLLGEQIGARRKTIFQSQKDERHGSGNDNFSVQKQSGKREIKARLYSGFLGQKLSNYLKLMVLSHLR